MIAAASPQTVSASPLALTNKEFQSISTLARKEFGLELGKGKEQLVAARIGKVMRNLGFVRFCEYHDYLHSDATGQALVHLIDALTTNHTSFFREQAHFDFLVNRVFVDWDQRAPMRIWSAASSTGEEPYSIALAAREHFGPESTQLPFILATDISTRVLEKARAAVYPEDRFQDGIEPWLRRHLLQGLGTWKGWYRMCPEIRRMVDFQRLNLVESLPEIGRFSVIFCRNVMIYFSRATQQQVVNSLVGCLEPGGYLLVGHSESLTGITHDLQQIQPAVYRMRGGRN